MTTSPRIAIPVPTLSDLDYNRRCWPMYAEAVSRSGGIPVEVALGLPTVTVRRLMAECHGVLLPGSPADVDPARYGQERVPECAAADPAREEVDQVLLEEAAACGKPVFGVCFGVQMLNVWKGGTLIQDLTVLPVNHDAGRGVAIAHTASVAPDSLLGDVMDAAEAPLQEGFLRLPVNSSHHQAIGVPGDGLRVVARCPQDTVIEAVEGDRVGQYVIGVQWHPERTFEQSAASRALFARLVAEASA